MKNRGLVWMLSSYVLFSSVPEAQNAPAPIDLIDFVLTPNQADWNYAVNEPTFVEVTILKNDVPVRVISISYEFGPDMMPLEKEGVLVLKEGKGFI